MSTAQRLAPWPEQLGALSVFPRGAPSELGKAAARRAVVFAIASYDQSATASFCIRLLLEFCWFCEEGDRRSRSGQNHVQRAQIVPCAFLHRRCRCPSAPTT